MKKGSIAKYLTFFILTSIIVTTYIIGYIYSMLALCPWYSWESAGQECILAYAVGLTSIFLVPYLLYKLGRKYFKFSKKSILLIFVLALISPIIYYFILDVIVDHNRNVKTQNELSTAREDFHKVSIEGDAIVKIKKGAEGKNILSVSYPISISGEMEDKNIRRYIVDDSQFETLLALKLESTSYVHSCYISNKYRGRWVITEDPDTLTTDLF